MKKIYPWLLCFLSAGLLILAFPRTDLWILAWGGLIPLMFALDGKNPWEAFRSAYLCGFLFFAGTLYWFFNITRWFSFIAALGILILFLYLALYFGLFGYFYNLFSKRKPLFKLFLLPSVWVALEFIRAHLFTGFDWASLGHSQYRNLPVIQIADMTGVFGISFIIVMVNVLLKEMIDARMIRKEKGDQKSVSAMILATAIIVTAILGYGAYRLSSVDRDRKAPRLSIAVIQPSIPQEMKWDKSSRALMLAKHIALTKRAAAENPDLIIWPETSHPDYLWEERELFDQIQAFVRRIQIPVLLGSVVKEGKDYYNAALLLKRDAQVAEIYRKVHLVPFGEFIPFRKWIPFISEILDIGDFTRGTQMTVFPTLKGGGLFSVLICFEDTVAGLSRGFVQEGAQFLVNITNDAWFGKTKAPYMHLQSAVFRTVENRRAMARAANTGVSCFIEPSGQIGPCVEGQRSGTNEKTYIKGYVVSEVPFVTKETFYTKFGDVFAILCFGCILMGIAAQRDN